MEKNKPIQLFVPTYRVDECLAEIKECLEVGWTGIGFKTVKFEEAWKEYTGLKHAHFLNSNTVGLHLAFHVLKSDRQWKDGDEVITTPLTFVSSNHAILYENLKPVFADVDETLCLDPQSIAKCITPRTRAVLYVGIGGNAGQLSKVQELCRQKGLDLILDAAHMAGTRYQGQHVGQGATCTGLSFQAVKNLPTADSGMICFADGRLDARVRKLSWLGINKDTFARTSSQGNYKWYYDVEEVGLKANGNSVMAAIGLTQLRYLDSDNQVRRDLAAEYTKQLKGFSEVRLVKHLDDCVSSRHLFQIRVDASDRDPVMQNFNDASIFPGVHYRINTHYRMYRDGMGKCPAAEKADGEILSLPLHLKLSTEDVTRIVKCLGSYYEAKARTKKAA